MSYGRSVLTCVSGTELRAGWYQIVLCLPVGYFFYYNVLQYHYYSQLHILTVAPPYLPTHVLRGVRY